MLLSLRRHSSHLWPSKIRPQFWIQLILGPDAFTSNFIVRVFFVVFFSLIKESQCNQLIGIKSS